MGEVIGLIFFILLSLFFTVGYYMLGSRANRKIDEQIKSGEEAYGKIALLSLKRPDEAQIQSLGCTKYRTELISTGITLGIDNTRTWLASLKMLIGGQVGYFADLQVRGREISNVRLQKRAAELGAVAVYNVKFETSNLMGNNDVKASKRAAVEFLAYGTAIIPID